MSVNNGSFTRTNLGQTDGNNYPRFHLASVQDMVASEREGREIWYDEERVEIFMPGNPYTRPVEKVSNEHKQRWPKEYAAFKDGIELSPEGTPLEEWSILKRSQVMELKGLGFKTVEQISCMDDHAIQRIPMYGRRLKELAEVFLDDANRIALTNKLSVENDKKDAEITALRRQVEEMGTLMASKFAELQTFKDAPNPIATQIPGMADPIALAHQAQPQEVVTSSLANIGSPRRGRTPMPRDADGKIIREAKAG